MSNALANGLAGAGRGIIAQMLTYPLQTVNTRQQTERTARDERRRTGLEGSGESSRSATGGGGTLVLMVQLITTAGWGGLYSGLKPSLIGTAASKGIYYHFYQVFKNSVEAVAAGCKQRGKGDSTVGILPWLVVAAIAGSLNVLLTSPIWVLVTRMQELTPFFSFFCKMSLCFPWCLFLSLLLSRFFILIKP